MDKTFKFMLPMIIVIMTACGKKPKPIGEAPLQLDEFDFNTSITTLFPDKNKSKLYSGYYEIGKDKYDHIMFQKDTTYIENYPEKNKAIGFEYHQTSWNNDTRALFLNQAFQRISVATTLDGKIKVINSVADDIMKKESDQLLKLIEKKYGQSEKIKDRWQNKSEIYQWKTKDRIIRYITKYDDETGNVKIVLDKDHKTIEEGKKEPHYEGYIFIVNTAFKDEVFGRLGTGDLSEIGVEKSE